MDVNGTNLSLLEVICLPSDNGAPNLVDAITHEKVPGCVEGCGSDFHCSENEVCKDGTCQEVPQCELSDRPWGNGDFERQNGTVQFVCSKGYKTNGGHDSVEVVCSESTGFEWKTPGLKPIQR